MTHSTIIFSDTTVTKIADPHLMRVEIAKTIKAYEISINCGLFRVPKVLEYDEKNGVALFERLNIKPISKAVPWGESSNKLAECLGRCLAIIHKEMILPDEMRIQLPSIFNLPRDEVFLHGDLSVQNVCVGSCWPPITIIDWQMTPMFGGESTYGSRYYDIFWFIGNLFNRPFMKFIMNNPLPPVAKIFLSSYVRESNISYDVDSIVYFAGHYYDVVLSQTKRVRLKQHITRVMPYLGPVRSQFIESFHWVDQ